MNNNFMNRVNKILAQNQQPQPNMPAQEVYPDSGIGALENVVSAPFAADIAGEPHNLAYINQEEANLLRNLGGSGAPGPSGIPAYSHNRFHSADQGSMKALGNYTGRGTWSKAKKARYAATAKAEDDKAKADAAAALAANNALLANPGSNTFTESLANVFTPGDGASYVNGQLINTATGESLTGGGYVGDDYIYGVADNFDNNFVDTTGMGNRQASSAVSKAAALGSIPPSMTSYLASYIPGMVLPVIGGAIGEKMLAGGIEERRGDVSNDLYNLNYDPTGGYSGDYTNGALTGIKPRLASTATAAGSKTAGEEYADSMRQAGLLSIGGKQTPKGPTNVGNTPILKFDGSDGSYSVDGALNANLAASVSTTNADGSLYIPYDGYDPHTINSNTNFFGSTDENASDYNMSKDLAETGSYVNLSGDTKKGTAFTTDFPANGAAILNAIGTDLLVETGDDGKMVLGVLGGGYEYTDGTQITNKVFEDDLTTAIEAGKVVIPEDSGGCPPGFEYDEALGSCVPVRGGGGGGGNGCPTGFTYDPVTDSCVEDEVKSNGCPTGFTYDPVTDSCVKDEVKSNGCPTGFTYDPVTDSCVKDKVGGGGVIVDPIDEVIENGIVTIDPSILAIYNRYYRGGSGKYLPAWLQRYVSGQTLDLQLTEVTVDGKKYYKTTDGRYIDPEMLAGAANLGSNITINETTNDGGSSNA